MFLRPEPSEYARYYETYTSKVPEGDIRVILVELLNNTVPFLLDIGDEGAAFRYEADKWSIKQVIGHVVDIERVFLYRALIIARGDTTPQPGVDQDVLVAGSNYDSQTLAEIVSQYQVVRQGTIAFFNSCDDKTAMRVGTASDCEFSVRSIPYILAGHEIHHVAVVRERYLKNS